jgi:hypothetical protein
MFRSITLGLSLGLLLAGCDHSAPQEGETDATVPITASTAKEIAKSATNNFKPNLLDKPVLGFYEPDFAYSVRSGLSSRKATEGAVSTVSLEFWGTSMANANASIGAKMESRGYKIAKTSKSINSTSTTYSVDGKSNVLVNVALKGNREMRAPKAIGTVYFRWTETAGQVGYRR